MYQKKGCKMTNQEIATKVSQLINYNVNKEGVTCKEFAARKKLKDMRADWKPEKEPNMNEEIELIKKWVKEREDFINE